MADPPAPHCPNCEQPLPQPRPGFCPACGQETQVRAPRLGEFLQQFGGAYLSTEGALWRTLKLLLLQPGELTRQYLAGRRKHYVLPLRLYLTISVVVLLLVRATASVQIEAAEADAEGAGRRSVTIGLGEQGAAQAERRTPKSVIIGLGVGQAGLRDGVFFCENLPQWLCRRVQRRLDVDPHQLRREALGVGERFIANLGAAMFVLLPTFALWLKLAYLNRRLRYTEHLVFALHVHAFWFLMFALVVARQPWLSGLALLAVPVYTLLAMRRVYRGRWAPRLLRAALVSVLYGATMGLALAGVGLWSLLF